MQIHSQAMLRCPLPLEEGPQLASESAPSNFRILIVNEDMRSADTLKRTLRDGADMPLAGALAHEQAMIGLVLDSADAHEGCRAFLEKRPARFEGR